MDWFVALTPLLLIPILGLFAFVGCSLLFKPSDPDDPDEPPDLGPPDILDPGDTLAPPEPPALATVNIRVRFFPRSLGSNSDEYRIVVSGVGPVDIAQERAPDSLSPPPEREATYDLTAADGSAFSVAAGVALEISCRVFEPDAGPILVASVDPHCQRTLDAGESYEIEFSAPENNSFFDPCTVVLT